MKKAIIIAILIGMISLASCGSGKGSCRLRPNYTPNLEF